MIAAGWIQLAVALIALALALLAVAQAEHTYQAARRQRGDFLALVRILEQRADDLSRCLGPTITHGPCYHAARMLTSDLRYTWPEFFSGDAQAELDRAIDMRARR